MVFYGPTTIPMTRISTKVGDLLENCEREWLRSHSHLWDKTIHSKNSLVQLVRACHCKNSCSGFDPRFEMEHICYVLTAMIKEARIKYVKNLMSCLEPVYSFQMIMVFVACLCLFVRGTVHHALAYCNCYFLGNALSVLFLILDPV